jgi:voltage-gated potassium channel Kch
MVSILAAFAAMTGFLRELTGLFKEPKYRAVVVWIILLLLTGTIFYHLEEGWSWLDALYFSVITLSTVGYGDLDPSTPLSKVFTMAFIILGVSIFVSFASMLAQERVNIHRQRAKPTDGDE